MAHTTAQELWLSVDVAARRLGYPPRIFRQLADSGALPAVRVGRTVVIAAVDVEDWALAHLRRHGPGAPSLERGIRAQVRETGGA